MNLSFTSFLTLLYDVSRAPVRNEWEEGTSAPLSARQSRRFAEGRSGRRARAKAVDTEAVQWDEWDRRKGRKERKDCKKEKRRKKSLLAFVLGAAGRKSCLCGGVRCVDAIGNEMQMRL